jgi:hypothetical protein
MFSQSGRRLLMLALELLEINKWLFPQFQWLLVSCILDIQAIVSLGITDSITFEGSEEDLQLGSVELIRQKLRG